MASVYIFCERAELAEWINELSKAKELQVFSYGTKSDFGVLCKSSFVLTDDVYQIYMFRDSVASTTNLDLSSTRPRDWGWLDIRPGGVRTSAEESALLLSEFHGEKCEDQTNTPVKWVQILKGMVKDSVVKGVHGKNMMTGGESTYMDIWYTKGAEQLANSGVVWKQFAGGRVVFTPLPQ